MRIGLTEKNSVEYVEKLLRIWNSGNSAVLIDCDTPPVIQLYASPYVFNHTI